MPTEEQVKEALKSVIDPELHQNIVDLGMVRRVDFFDEGRVDVVVSLTTPGCPIRSHFENGVAEAVGKLDGVSAVNVGFDVLSPQEKQALQQSLGGGSLPSGSLARVGNVICVGSGKGGVGKSTVTANLAAALHAEGHRAAALDADVWGYSIPRMMGVHGKPMVSAERKILPLEVHDGIRVMSIEFFLEGRDQAITWRGPMLHKAIRQFLEDVEWGELDYLLIDLPPGTGDVSMTLAQLLPQSKFVVVTTPQPAAQKVAQRAAETARRFNLEIAGVVENMSGFTTPERRALHDLRRGRRPAAGRRARRSAARQDPAPGGAASGRGRGPSAGSLRSGCARGAGALPHRPRPRVRGAASAATCRGAGRHRHPAADGALAPRRPRRPL